MTLRLPAATLAVLAASLLLAPGLGHLPPAAASAAPLAGRVVVIDPGHDGGNASHPAIVNKLVYAGNGLYKPCNTVGTATNSGYAEHAFTWNVAKRVRTILIARGATVVMTRPVRHGGRAVHQQAGGNRQRQPGQRRRLDPR